MPLITKCTVNIKTDLLSDLKGLIANDHTIPSISFALNDAVEYYLKMKRKAKYESLMYEASKDKKFIKRLADVEESYAALEKTEMDKW